MPWPKPRNSERTRLLAMMGLYFLVLFAVGILKPIRNALALDGLGESEFYKVYLVSAVVILLAPAFNHLSDRIPWRTLIPATAAFFAANLFLFRGIYSEGSAALGMVFYGWYDLFAAALVTQFFMAVQVFFNARDAKSAVPLVIAAGSCGATLGGLLTGLMAQRIGTPNLILVAAFFVGFFAVGLPFVWTGYPTVRRPGRRVIGSGAGGVRFVIEDFVRVFSHRHVRLIAGLVLATVIVKTLVDYEFNEAVAAHAGDRDAISSFQGYVFGAINWLPIVILLPLGPLLKRWGVGLVVLMLPLAMLGFTVALATAFSVWTATLAKAGDSTFRYSAERTGREILYVPVPTELKLRAKAYVDMALEKGFGKACSGLLILVLLAFMDYRRIAWVAAALAAIWCVMAVAANREYVRALATAIRSRFSTLEVGVASLTERSALAMVGKALRGDTVQVSFALDLVEEAGSVDAGHLGADLQRLMDHSDADVRSRVLRLLTRFPGLIPDDVVRRRLGDEDEAVRKAAVGALAARCSEIAAREELLRGLLESDDWGTRCAALSWLADEDEDMDMTERLGAFRVAALHANGAVSEHPSAARRELALALGLGPPGSMPARILARLMDDPDAAVARSAVRSAGRLGAVQLRYSLISKLGDRSLRGEVRAALVRVGPDVVESCVAPMRDPAVPMAIRRSLASVIGLVDSDRSVRALMEIVSDRKIDREVRFHALKALNKFRARNGTMRLEPSDVLSAIDVEIQEAERYSDFLSILDGAPAEARTVRLLRTALRESWRDRREAVFRLLGLVFPHDEIYRSHFALVGDDDRARANATEWLERTLGHRFFQHVGSVIPGEPTPDASEVQRDWSAVLNDLGGDRDPWMASVATWARDETRSQREGGGSGAMDLIEKLFLLQKVDLLQEARSTHLGLLASIAEELDVDRGDVVLRPGEPNDALYVIVRGSVELSGVGDERLELEAGTPFGTWSLFDADPSMIGARALEPSRLLRVTRSDFQDLLGDHPELATGILQALARRMRSLVA
ncbi:MAG: HEAT repeat domain-containing protein [Gemmatimonadota bacterium]